MKVAWVLNDGRSGLAARFATATLHGLVLKFFVFSFGQLTKYRTRKERSLVFTQDVILLFSPRKKWKMEMSFS